MNLEPRCDGVVLYHEGKLPDGGWLFVVPLTFGRGRIMTANDAW